MDDLLADYERLTDPATRREVERRGNFFIVEGDLAIRALIDTRDRWPIRSILVTPARRAALADALATIDAATTPVIVEPIERLRAIAGFDVHRGALASAERGTHITLDEALRTQPPLVVVLEAVNDHENVGSVFRSAAAFGAGAVLLDDRTADPLYRRSVRVSLGHVLRVPFARVDSIADVRDRGYTTLALTPRGHHTIDDIAHDRPERAALLIGAEGPGLSPEAIDAADHTVRIPMRPGIDSLNLGVAAAIAMHRLYTSTT